MEEMQFNTSNALRLPTPLLTEVWKNYGITEEDEAIFQLSSEALLASRKKLSLNFKYEGRTLLLGHCFCLIMGHSSLGASSLYKLARALQLPRHLIYLSSTLLARQDLADEAKKGLGKLKRLHHRDNRIFKLCAAMGSVDLLEQLFLITRNKNIFMRDVFEIAAKYGQIDVIIWIKCKVFGQGGFTGGEQGPCGYRVFNNKIHKGLTAASSNGHINVLQWYKDTVCEDRWIVESGRGECYRYAARNNQLDVLKWLDKEAGPTNFRARKTAFFESNSKKHHDITKYLLSFNDLLEFLELQRPTYDLAINVYIESEITRFRADLERKERDFNWILLPEEHLLYFIPLQYLIKQKTRESIATLEFLLKLPALERLFNKNCILNINLLLFALSVDNREAVALLFQNVGKLDLSQKNLTQRNILDILEAIPSGVLVLNLREIGLNHFSAPQLQSIKKLPDIRVLYLGYMEVLSMTTETRIALVNLFPKLQQCIFLNQQGEPIGRKLSVSVNYARNCGFKIPLPSLLFFAGFFAHPGENELNKQHRRGLLPCLLADHDINTDGLKTQRKPSRISLV